MGWLINHRGLGPHETVDSRMREELSWSDHDARSGDKHTIIASATVGSTWYAALEIVRASGERSVVALVCLTTRRGGFGYKDMDETMGPNECSCPARILDLLTETDSEYAIEWRKRCRDAGKAKSDARQAMPKPGDRIVFNAPLNYRSFEDADFTVVPTPPRNRGLIGVRTKYPAAGLFRLPIHRLTEATVIPA